MFVIVHRRGDGTAEYLADRTFTAWIADVRQARRFASEEDARAWLGLDPAAFALLNLEMVAAPPGG